MEKSIKKSGGLTLAEAILVLIIIGVIAAITIPQLLVENPTKKGWDTMAEKTAGVLVQANTQILIYDTKLDDFTRLIHNGTEFSIASASITSKLSDLYKKYISHVVGKINLNDKYFTDPLIDYNRATVSSSLKSAYSNFFYTNDGVVVGFRTYGSCSATEANANPPTYRAKYSVANVCGSIFYDVNGTPCSRYKLSEYNQNRSILAHTYVYNIYKRYNLN